MTSPRSPLGVDVDPAGPDVDPDVDPERSPVVHAGRLGATPVLLAAIKDAGRREEHLRSSC